MKKIIAALALLMSCIGVAKAQSPYEFRGMHVDLKAQVMTMDALYSLADREAELGLNTLLMEWEGSFPFEENACLSNKLSYTRKEVSDFIAYCASKGIEVIPLQNCFGHSEYILHHERYADVRESATVHSQFCPSKAKAEATNAVVSSIFKEVAEMHPSKYFHIGCDETYLLGACNDCQAEVAESSLSDLFVDYVSRMCKIVRDLGKTPIIWGDIILKHPEAADKLPKDLIVMDWNYGWKKDFFGPLENVSDTGIEMWGATALRSNPDNIYQTYWNKHFDNLSDYVPFTKKLGFRGLIQTSWSSSGIYSYIMGNSWDREEITMQPLRIQYPLSGFDILIAGFAKATEDEEVFDKEAFIREYCAERYGLDEKAQEVMLNYFNTPQTQRVFANFKASLLQEDLDAALAIKEGLDTFKARKNKKEFAHFVLMMDLRINFLKFKLTEREFESEAGTRASMDSFKSRFHGIVKDAHKLRKRFIKINKNYLKDPMETIGDWTYIKKAEELEKQAAHLCH